MWTLLEVVPRDEKAGHMPRQTTQRHHLHQLLAHSSPNYFVSPGPLPPLPTPISGWFVSHFGPCILHVLLRGLPCHIKDSLFIRASSDHSSSSSCPFHALATQDEAIVVVVCALLAAARSSSHRSASSQFRHLYTGTAHNSHWYRDCCLFPRVRIVSALKHACPTI